MAHKHHDDTKRRHKTTTRGDIVKMQRDAFEKQLERYLDIKRFYDIIDNIENFMFHKYDVQMGKHDFITEVVDLHRLDSNSSPVVSSSQKT